VTTRPPERRLEAVVHGVVQGVGFRFHVMRAAARLDLRGWVSNESDGTVHAVAEGSEADLAELLAALRRGPAGAVVERVVERWSAATGGLEPFGVRSRWHPGD
jgi:acylphosphatase